MNEIIESLYKRKSMRVYEERTIPEEMKRIILEAAAQAPSAGCQQLYTILDITDKELKVALSETCDNQPFIAKAPMVLVFCADCKKWYDTYLEAGCTPRKPGAGDLMLAVTDAAIAAQNAVVAAESFGIGSCYIGDIMENCEEQRRLLKLPEYVFPAEMLCLDGQQSSRNTDQNQYGLNRSTLYMKIHTAVWTEKNFEICLKAAADRKALRTGLQLFAAVNIILIFQKK